MFQEVLANLNKDTLTQIPLTSQFSCRFDPSEPGPGCPMTVDAEVLQGQRVQVLLIMRVGKNSKESRFESKKLTIVCSLSIRLKFPGTFASLLIFSIRLLPQNQTNY